MFCYSIIIIWNWFRAANFWPTLICTGSIITSPYSKPHCALHSICPSYVCPVEKTTRCVSYDASTLQCIAITILWWNEIKLAAAGAFNDTSKFLPFTMSKSQISECSAKIRALPPLVWDGCRGHSWCSCPGRQSVSRPSRHKLAVGGHYLPPGPRWPSQA